MKSYVYNMIVLYYFFRKNLNSITNYHQIFKYLYQINIVIDYKIIKVTL